MILLFIHPSIRCTLIVEKLATFAHEIEKAWKRERERDKVAGSDGHKEDLEAGLRQDRESGTELPL